MSDNNRIDEVTAITPQYARDQPVLEVMTPGKHGNGDREIAIQYGVHDTALGTMFVAITPRGVCRMEFLDGGNEDGGLAGLRRDWPKAELTRNDRATSHAVEALFGEPADGRHGLVPLHVVGTEFQVAVWRALLRIPRGTLASYSQIACELGSAKSSRAVGNAIGANPVAVLIPCHRVIQKSGAMGGYRWGAARKKRVQEWENSQVPPAP
ncbi:methylated-DNA--[protein]-cysteine S-methyltransferase [Marinobacter vulgaris]|nr:methylated-DNA--[protein]-cysteine S-methyltransferase [Marinobacter vulgaris]